MTNVAISGATPLQTQLANAVEAARQSPANDAFGRARVSQPTALFTSAHVVNESPEFWQSIVTAGGLATHVPNESCVNLTVATSGDRIIRQTFRYFRYIPGKSQLVILTGTFGAAATNVRKRLGYYDDSNGLFFEQTSAGMFVVRRTNITGTPADNRVAQADWNIDAMDGRGPSGLTLDVTKSNIFVIDFEWLGVGRQRFGVNIDGMTYYVHEIKWANRGGTGVYMSRGSLPVRYGIEATGAITGTPTLKQICSTVVSEGGSETEQSSRLRAAANGTTGVSVTTRRPVLTIRPKLTFNSLPNRAFIAPLDVEFINTGNQSVYVEVIRNGTLPGTPTWTSDTDSVVESTPDGTAITGGTRVWAGYVAGATQGGRLNVPLEDIGAGEIPLTLDYAGTASTNFSVVCTSFGAATTVSAAIAWREIY